MNFIDASAVTREGAGLFSSNVQPGWDIFGVTNGGYLLATATKAMGEEAGDRTLASVSARFINPGAFGPATIEVRKLKEGRSLSALEASLSMGERTILTANASFVDPPGERPRQIIIKGTPPDLPPVEECIRLLPTGDAPLPPPFSANVEIYLHPDDYKIGGSEPRDYGPRMRGWFRLTDGQPTDPFGLVLAADAMPPAIFNSDLPIGWTPTVDLTVHVRDPGPHQWLKCSYVTRFVTDGWLEEDGEIWDAEDNLVAQSRQLALVPRG